MKHNEQQVFKHVAIIIYHMGHVFHVCIIHTIQIQNYFSSSTMQNIGVMLCWKTIHTWIVKVKYAKAIKFHTSSFWRGKEAIPDGWPNTTAIFDLNCRQQIIHLLIGVQGAIQPKIQLPFCTCSALQIRLRNFIMSYIQIHSLGIVT